MKKNKFLFGCLLLSFSLTSCDLVNDQFYKGTKEPEIIQNEQIQSIYRLYKSNGGELSYEEWLESLKGENGLTPFIGDNGNWWIGSNDTGVRAQSTDSFSFLQGETDPSNSLGKNGDSYLNTSTGMLFYKEAGVWVYKITFNISHKQEAEPEDFAKIFDYNNQYRALVKQTAEAINNKEGYPKDVDSSISEYKRNGPDLGYIKEDYTEYLIGTPSEFAVKLSSYFEEEITENNVNEYISRYSQEKGYEYKFEDGFYTLLIDDYSDEIYYDYSNDDLFPLTWEMCEDEGSQNYGKYTATVHCGAEFDDFFDYLIDLKEYFNYNREKSRFEFDVTKGLESNLLVDEEESIDYFYIYVKDGLATKIEMDSPKVLTPGPWAHIISTVEIEKDDSLALPSADKRAPICEHKNISENITGRTGITSMSGTKHYHYKTCYDCGSDVCIEECTYEEGICTVCHDVQF